MCSKLTTLFVALLSVVFCACAAPIEDEQLDATETDRTEAAPVPDIYGAITVGQIWSSPPGVMGLGGIGREVALGELELKDIDGKVPFPQMATLTLGLQRPFDNNWGGGMIYAKIQFGIGAANQTAYIDWYSGNSIALPVGKCTVTAVQTDSQGAPVLPLPAGYALRPADAITTSVILTASLAAFERSSVFAPILSQSFDFAPGILVAMRVPPRAKGLIVGDPRGQALSDLRVELITANGINRFFLANGNDSTIRTTGITLGNSDYIQVLSPGGIANVPFTWLLEG